MAITKAKREKKQLAISSWQLAKPKAKKKQFAISNWHLAKAKPGNKKRTRSSFSITQSPTHQLTKFGSASFALPKTRLTHFRELKGKIVEDVVFSAAPDHQDITIKLQDKTGLNFSIGTGLILKTEYSDWTDGEQRILRRWPLKSTS